MAYSSKNYKALKAAGYAANEAHKLASAGTKRLNDLVQTKIIENLESGVKLTRSAKRQYARAFGFTSEQADRLKGFSNKNLLQAVTTKTLPAAGELFKTRAAESINYKNALSYHMLIAKARMGEKYFYKVRYEVFSELDFFRTEKFTTVISSKKLNKREVFQRVLNDLSVYDEVYKAVPDPRSFEIVEAFYMSQDDYKKLRAEKDRKK